MAGSVFVKRAGDVDAVFAKVEIFGADTVTRLAERASLKLDWRTTAAYVDLFLVPAESEEAVDSGESGSEALVLATRPLSSIKALSAVGIRDRCCLLARLSSPPTAAPGECARTRPAASFRARRAGGPEGLAGRARESAGVFAGALTLFRPRFCLPIPRRRQQRQQRGGCSRRWRCGGWQHLQGGDPRDYFRGPGGVGGTLPSPSTQLPGRRRSLCGDPAAV